MPWKLHPPGKRGPYWYLRGTDASGRFEVSTGTTSRKDAQVWTDEFLDKRASERVPGAGETVGFRTAAGFYKAANPHLSDDDIKLVDAVAGEIGEIDCRTVTHAHLVAAADELKAGRAPATKNRKVIAPGAAVLHYAASQRWCHYQRIEKFWESRKSNREPASIETMVALMEHVEDASDEMAPQWHGVDPHLAHKKLLIAMLYELGLRITDYLLIEWPHINLGAAKVAVRIGKTDEWAMLELSAEIVAMMANLPVKTGKLLPWSNRVSVYKWLNRAKKRAKVHYTPHLSRHALATDAQDIPDKKAAELGVWRDPRSLHRYQHVKPEPIPGRDASQLMARGKVGGRRS